MALVQSTQNAFQLVDRTNELLLLPQTWTLLGDSGLFKNEYLATQTVTFEERNGSLSLVKDQVRGGKPQTRNGEVRKLHSYMTTHHPIVDALYPSELVGATRPGSNGQQVDTKDAAIVRKMEGIRKSFAVTLEVARFKTLSTGQIFAPNGTVAGDFYTDFGKTRKSVDFVLGTATTDVIAKCAETIAHFQEKATEGQVISRVVGYASSGFFTKLIAHAKVTQAHIYQQIGQYNITQERNAGLYRRLSFGGIDFIEVPTVIAGEALVPAGECLFVADAMDDTFVTYFSPADRFGYVNTLAAESYMWTFEAPNLKEINVEAEMNMLNIIRRPDMVAKGTSSN
jgi:hypothetical protein